MVVDELAILQDFLCRLFMLGNDDDVGGFSENSMVDSITGDDPGTTYLPVLEDDNEVMFQKVTDQRPLVVIQGEGYELTFSGLDFCVSRQEVHRVGRAEGIFRRLSQFRFARQ